MESLFLYQADDRALIYLLKKGHPYLLAKKELAALIRIHQDKEYLSSKIEALKPLQKELLALHYLYKLPVPGKSFEGKNVLISGYHNGLRISSILGELPNMAISYDFSPRASVLPEVASFPDIYDELHYLYNTIGHDIKAGIPIDTMRVIGADHSYDPLFKEFNKLYGFAIETTYAPRLFDTPLYRDFAALFLEKGLEQTIETLLPFYSKDRDFAEIMQFGRTFAGVFESPKKELALYDEIARSKQSTLPKFDHVVRRENDFLPPPNSKVYLVNFAMGAFPRIFAEDDYLFDYEAAELGLETSEEKTREDAAEFDALLTSGMIGSISFKASAFGAPYFLSGLVKRKGLELVQNPRLGEEYAHDQLRYYEAALLDEKVNYLRLDPQLPALEKHRPVPDYRSYDCSFKRFVPPLKAKRSYSPTSLSEYYGCPFSYYLDRLLLIGENDETFSARIGRIFHSVMEELYKNKDFTFETAWAEALEKEKEHGEYTAKEEALFLRLKEECSYAVAFYQEHDSLLSNPAYYSEVPFELPLEGSAEVFLRGQFDKIVEFGKDQRYYIVLDYKTGGTRFDEEMLPYGLSVQLPFYAYYAEHAEKLASGELIGLFIGPLLSPTLVKPVKDSLEKFNADKFKFEGVFAKDIDKLVQLDPSCQNGASSLVRSLNYGKNGFQKYSLARAKSPEEFVSFAASAAELVKRADEAIKEGHFEIAPIVFKNKFNACAYCQFRDVCYRKDEMVRHLPEVKMGEDEDEESEGDDNEVV
jgi:CRISPR/Cas system-associated exonuclease Cas4 (RecB family)